ncbi:MAG: 1,4-dihydroxy-2-naphthoate polyprenyltransferase, partial [Myxococcota bacterium]
RGACPFMNAPPSPVKVWIQASRPPTLVAALIPVAVGTAIAVAHGSFRADAAIAALVGAILIQIGTNFANDVFDFEKGADNEDRLGPTRAVAAGLLSPRAMRNAMILVFALAFVPGIYLATVAGLWVLGLGVVSILAGIGYTGGPYPLAYNGLGDIFVFAFFGFAAVFGTIAVQGSELGALGWGGAVAVGALSTAILVVNNVRDLPTDRKANKRTLVTRFGRTFGLAEYAVMLLLPYVTLLSLIYLGEPPLLALAGLTFPVAVMLWIFVAKTEGKKLNKALFGTAMLLLSYGALFSVGVAFGASG